MRMDSLSAIEVSNTSGMTSTVDRFTIRRTQTRTASSTPTFQTSPGWAGSLETVEMKRADVVGQYGAVGDEMRQHALGGFVDPPARCSRVNLTRHATQFGKVCADSRELAGLGSYSEASVLADRRCEYEVEQFVRCGVLVAHHLSLPSCAASSVRDRSDDLQRRTFDLLSSLQPTLHTGRKDPPRRLPDPRTRRPRCGPGRTVVAVIDGGLCVLESDELALVLGRSCPDWSG